MKTILFQGDSITDCGRHRERHEFVGDGYVQLVKAQLGFECPEQYEFQNRGIGGDRIVDVYARIKADIINLKPDIMSILVGVNDVGQEFSKHNGVGAEKFEKIYCMMIEEIKEALPNVKIMIMEPFCLRASVTENTEEENLQAEAVDEAIEYCLVLEDRIEEILSSMEGVGQVQAMVTVSSSKELIVEKDEPINRSTVTETDGSGGTRSTNESNYEYETIYETDSNGNKIPYVVKHIEPQIQGITVVAQGGGDALIQKNISDVLEALFHLEAHKIKVVKMK